MSVEGWIDGVRDGIVYGRVVEDGQEKWFTERLMDVPECQRVDLEPGSYISFVNGYLLVHKWQWTTHKIEQAHKEARRLAAILHSP